MDFKDGFNILDTDLYEIETNMFDDFIISELNRLLFHSLMEETIQLIEGEII